MVDYEYSLKGACEEVPVLWRRNRSRWLLKKSRGSRLEQITSVSNRERENRSCSEVNRVGKDELILGCVPSALSAKSEGASLPVRIWDLMRWAYPAFPRRAIVETLVALLGLAPLRQADGSAWLVAPERR